MSVHLYSYCVHVRVWWWRGSRGKEGAEKEVRRERLREREREEERVVVPGSISSW